MLQELGLPHAVLLNRADIGDDGVHGYCQSQEIEILMEIPEDRAIAEAYSRGRMLIAEQPDYVGRFLELYKMIEGRVENAAHGRS
jgi:MinD superfamily P-loop ATPase